MEKDTFANFATTSRTFYFPSRPILATVRNATVSSTSKDLVRVLNFEMIIIYKHLNILFVRNCFHRKHKRCPRCDRLREKQLLADEITSHVTDTDSSELLTATTNDE